MPAFVLDLATLKQGHGRLEMAGAAADTGLDGPEWVAPVTGTIQSDRNGDRISVRASLRTEVRLTCSRCLAEFPRTLAGELSLFADRAGGREALEEELERGDYMKFHDGRHLDLREEVREALLIELPIAPLCREDCAGLCPACGANRNEETCGCASARAGRPA